MAPNRAHPRVNKMKGDMRDRRPPRIVVAAAQSLDKARIQEFMLTAEVVAAEPIGKGVMQPWRLTLSDGAVTHDVAFQSVDERSTQQRLGTRRELGFVDVYRYNSAAYRVASCSAWTT